MQPEIQSQIAAENAPGSSLEHGRVNSLLQAVQDNRATEFSNQWEMTGTLIQNRCILLTKLLKCIFLYRKF